MKQVIRNCVFETNSSSEHVLSHTCQVGRGTSIDRCFRDIERSY